MLYLYLFDKRVVEKSIEHAEFAIDLKNIFPDSKFVHIIRNPYSNLVALRRYKMRKTQNFPVLTPDLSTLRNSFYHLYRNQRLLRSYLVVRYEDILQRPKETTGKIANFIGIDYVDALVKPTSLGMEWADNSSRGKSFQGVSVENIDLWKTDINDLEIHFINEHFEFVIQDYGYEKLTPKHNYFPPVRNELPKTYLINGIASRYI